MSKPTIKIGGVTVPANLSQKDLIKFLVENKALLIAEKKAELKQLDEGITVPVDIGSKYFIDKEGKLNKSTPENKAASGGPETVLCVINTTNWMDGHSDVHIPGIWNKSLKDNSVMLHLQEHNMSFDKVISDESKGYTQKMPWKELGYDFPGNTEALIFSTPLTGRNPFMEEQYRKGFVKNHSVGMRYVTIKLCVNDSEDKYFKEEYANWGLYAPQVVNLKDAEEQGYFWAVVEAKIVEGSAVVKGSNIITPTIGFKSVQPAAATESNEPPEGTQGKEEKLGVDWDKIATHKLFN